MIISRIDSNIKNKKLEDFVELPKIIYVQDFTPSAVQTFERQIQEAQLSIQPVIPIVIDSYGGYCYSLMAMIDRLKTVKKPIATICLGKAMSCGAVLFSCGTEGYRFAAPNSTFMIHEVASMNWGKIEEMKADVKEADRLNSIIFDLMAKNCGKKPNYFSKIVHDKSHADWFLDAKEAKAHNLANHISIPNFFVDIKMDISFNIND